MKYVFTHGGPGFSSYAEEQMLKPEMKSRGVELFCWNEPSPQRPEGSNIPAPGENAFEFMMKDLAETLKGQKAKSSEKFGVISHSYSAKPLLAVVQDNPGLIDELVLVTPAFVDDELDNRIFDIAENGFLDSGEMEKLAKMKERRKELTPGFNEQRFAVFGLAAECPALFPSYWKNQKRMGEYFQHLADERYAFSVEVFANIRFSSRLVDLSFLKNKIGIPTKIVLGKHDPIVGQDLVRKLANDCFSNATIKALSESGHYPHIEEMSDFLDLILY